MIVCTITSGVTVCQHSRATAALAKAHRGSRRAACTDGEPRAPPLCLDRARPRAGAHLGNIGDGGVFVGGHSHSTHGHGHGGLPRTVCRRCVPCLAHKLAQILLVLLLRARPRRGRPEVRVVALGARSHASRRMRLRSAHQCPASTQRGGGWHVRRARRRLTAGADLTSDTATHCDGRQRTH